LSSNNNATQLLAGTSEHSEVADVIQTRSFIDDILILSSATTMAIWHHTGNVMAYGLGLGGDSGAIEIFTIVRITKLR
jgi:hypothetical protein